MTALPPSLRALDSPLHDALAGCIACANRPACLFTRLGETEAAAQVRTAVAQRALPPNGLAAQQGRPGLRVQVVRHGTVKLQRAHPDGHVRVMRLLGPGQVFGLESLLHEPCSHDAVAVGQASLCVAPSGVLIHWARHDPQAHARLMHHWKACLDQADFVIDSLSTGTARERVRRLLQHLARHRRDGGFVAPSRADMGALLGLTTETASRVMAAFAREGLIQERDGMMFLQAERTRADAA